MAGVKGGDKLQAKFREIAGRVAQGDNLRVGFLEGSKYPDGTSLPMVAAVQEFGTVVPPNAPEEAKGIFRKAFHAIKRIFSKPSQTYRIPPRPYFRSMIAGKSKEWGPALGQMLKASNYDARTSLSLLGEGIKGQLQQSIRDLSEPPNAPSTVAKKGFDDPLIDSGHMLNSVDYEVKE